MAEIRHRKCIEAERDRVARANAELFDEAQRLSDKEAAWAEEKEGLEAELVSWFPERLEWRITRFVLNVSIVPSRWTILARQSCVNFFQAAVTQELETLKCELYDVEALEVEASERNSKMVRGHFSKWCLFLSNRL